MEWLRAWRSLARVVTSSRGQAEAFIEDALLGEQLRLVYGHLREMADTAERDVLLTFAQRGAQRREAFQERLSGSDLARFETLQERRFFETLRRTHAIFQEHGFSLLPELSALREAEGLTGAELAQELPVLPPARRRRGARPKIRG